MNWYSQYHYVLTSFLGLCFDCIHFLDVLSKILKEQEGEMGEMCAASFNLGVQIVGVNISSYTCGGCVQPGHFKTV